MQLSNLYRQRGVGLIEVLIAVVVLSIGLLGLAGLQALSLRNNQSAYHRSQATVIAYDIIERMRANKSQADAGAYTIALGTAPSSATNCESTSANCSASDMTTYDLTAWKCSLGNWNTQSVCANTLGIKGPLPNGDGAITRSGSVYTVTVQWTDDRDQNNTTLSIEAQP